MKRYIVDFLIIALLFAALSYIMVSWEKSENSWLEDYTELREDYSALANEYIELKEEYLKLLDRKEN